LQFFPWTSNSDVKGGEPFDARSDEGGTLRQIGRARHESFVVDHLTSPNPRRSMARRYLRKKLTVP
jgi:hypothetical protein